MTKTWRDFPAARAHVAAPPNNTQESEREAMNWIGGARSRIRQQADKKRQKEFFERKRLQTKVKKVVQPPKSPQERSRRAVSKDLLFLQAVSKAHDGPLDDDSLSRVKRLKLTGPRSLWPNRNISLPTMSPITHPSTLDLQDTTCDSDLQTSLFSLTNTNTTNRRAPPRVSTQKVPHRTVLRSFGQQNDPLPQNKAGRLVARRGEAVNQANRERDSLMTESVFSTRRERAQQVNNLSFMDESLGLRAKRPVVVAERAVGKKAASRLQTRGDWRDARQHSGRARMEFPDRNTKRRSLVAEKSYDHETPFNFDRHPSKERKEHVGKELPRAKPSLLDFHANESKAKQDRVAKGNGIESIAKGWRRPGPYSMAGKEPDIPAGRAVETADNTAQQWDSITPYYKEKASKNATLTSTSTVDEDPLSKKARPTSCCTVFNESILGPIRWHKGGTNSHSTSQQPTSPPQPTHHECDDSGDRKSAFERMMSAFDAYEKTAIQPLTGEMPVSGENEAGTEGGSDRDEVSGTTFEQAQSRKWQDFLGELTEQPRPPYNAAHKRWERFTSGLDDKEEDSNKPPTGQDVLQCQRVPDPSEELQENTDESCLAATTESRRSRLTSISVMDELMCLEEIGSTGNSCAAELASQELSFSPVAPSQTVPDMRSDAKITLCYRYMSENPLSVICHTPANTTCTTSEKKHDETDKQGTIEDLNKHNMDAHVSTMEHDEITSEPSPETTVTTTENKNSPVQVNAANCERINVSAASTSPVAETSKVLTQPDDCDMALTKLEDNAATTTDDDRVTSQEEASYQKKNTASVAVQCSLDTLSLSLPTARPLEEKSTQTESAAYTDSSVQAATEAAVEPSTQCHATESNVVVKCKEIVPESVSDVGKPETRTSDNENVSVLQWELDAMQNTVIWQALMLRLYGMH